MKEFSKKVVTLVIMLNVAFTGAVLYLFIINGSEPATLIGCWVGVTTVELWALSGITKTKITQGGGEEQWKP